jgi:dTDP-4-dehydrorhamnose 3,5-epimerase
VIVEKTQLEGVLLIKLEAFEDHRGWYLETYNEQKYRRLGIDVKFIQDDISVSSRHVLRGIHGDFETWKLISCLQGQFYLVVLNGKPDSPDFGRWQSFVLSEHNRHQVLVPPGYGNGHLVLSDRAIFHYKQSTNYKGASTQFTYRWNDERLNIWWPIKNPILSMRDEFGKIMD